MPPCIPGQEGGKLNACIYALHYGERQQGNICKQTLKHVIHIAAAPRGLRHALEPPRPRCCSKTDQKDTFGPINTLSVTEASLDFCLIEVSNKTSLLFLTSAKCSKRNFINGLTFCNLCKRRNTSFFFFIFIFTLPLSFKGKKGAEDNMQEKLFSFRAVKILWVSSSLGKTLFPQKPFQFFHENSEMKWKILSLCCKRRLTSLDFK